MSERPARPRAPHTDLSAVESLVGPHIVARLHGLLRTVRLYDLSNQAIQDQLRELMQALEQVMQDEVVLVAMGQCFYVNGVRVRAESSRTTMFDALTREFERRRLGGIRILAGVRLEELAVFLRLLAEHADAERAARLREAAAAAGVVHVAAVTLDELEAMGTPEAASDEATETDRERARHTYMQAVAGARGAILRTARTGRPAMRRIKRVVQPVVDSIMKNEYSIVGLTAIKNHDEYTYAHCVNVSILSVAMGHALGLPRPALANMGVAALLHDIGKLTIPPDVLRKSGSLTEHEWHLMERHPVEGFKTILHTPGLSTLTVDLMNVTLQHHRTCDAQGYPRIERPTGLSSVTRIVAVADCFDAMTAHRAYRRRPFTGHEALRLMLGPDRLRYDPAGLWALLKTVGLYPAGTLMIATTGHLVLSVSPNLEDMRRPHCRVLARPDGTMPSDVHPETWDPMPPEVSVQRVIDPDEFEGQVDRLLAA